MNNKKRNNLLNFSLIVIFLSFVLISNLMEFEPGKQSGKAFLDVLIEMLKIIPFAYIIIALIEVWVSEKTIIKQLGKNSGFMAYFWVLLLAGISIGGIYVGLPLAQTLHKKGASLPVIFAYLGFVGIVRIPMTIFEISLLGIPFTLIRLMVSIPLFLAIGIIWGKYLQKKRYKLVDA
jgi:uncharacterized membrane protein YraQ (UPF0718 family)